MYSASRRRARLNLIMSRAIDSTSSVSTIPTGAFSSRRFVSRTRYPLASSNSLIPSASNPCFVALNRVEVLFLGPRDLPPLIRLAATFLSLADICPFYASGSLTISDRCIYSHRLAPGCSSQMQPDCTNLGRDRLRHSCQFDIGEP